MNDWQAFGGELRRLRLQQDRSLRSLAKSIRYDAGALSRIENGLRRPPLKIAQDLDAELDAGGSLMSLASECGAFAPDGISAAAARSLAFADWATDAGADQLSVDSLHYEIARIASSYVHAPPQPLFNDLQLLRDQVWQLLRRGPSPARARELMFLGGAAIVLLAQVTDNLGNSVAAMQHALAAERLAERAQHTALLAWADGAKALIAEWSGNPAKAIEFAQQGALVAPPGEQRVRLAALEARCAARLGRAEQVRAAVTRALAAGEQAGDVDDITEFGGVLRFSMTKASYYIGSAFRLIGDYDEAERWANRAITAYQTGPSHERSYGDEALARVDVAIARIAHGSIDGAGEVLNPVLALPPGQRIHPVLEGLRQVDTHLQGQSGTGRRLRDEISSFRTPETWTQH